MELRERSATAVKALCEAHGWKVDKMVKVRARVYRALMAGGPSALGRQVYLKFYPPSKREGVERLTTIAAEVGHPDCRFIDDGDDVCLLMAAAAGQPISRALPLALLPGIRRTRKASLCRAYLLVGRYIGRLHAITERNSRPVLDAREISRALSRSDSLARGLSSRELASFAQLITSGAQVHAPCAMAYRDRAPHNLYMGGERVALIDCSCEWTSVLNDHSSSLLGILLAVGRLPYTRHRSAGDLKHAYLEGYEAAGRSDLIGGDAFRIHYAATISGLIDYYRKDRRSLAGRLVRRLDMPVLYAELRRLLKQP